MNSFWNKENEYKSRKSLEEVIYTGEVIYGPSSKKLEKYE